MFCPQCGTSNPNEAGFCANCGAALAGEAAGVAVPPGAEATLSGPDLASRLSRLGAKILDNLVLFIIYILVIVSAFAGSSGLVVVFLVIGLGYLALQTVWLSTRGQTTGKRIVGIKIVQASTGENGGFVSNVVLRAWVNGLLNIVPLYGLVDILFIFRNDRRCIHDLIAGTIVIQD